LVPQFFWKIEGEKNRMKQSKDHEIPEGKMKGWPTLEVFSDYV
jgi:hypothetical protein